MTATVLAPYLTQQFLSNIGMPLAGGLLFSYQAGTVTPAATYTDNTGVTPNPNPIVLNARGEVPALWILPNTAYKFVLQDPMGTPIWTRDQVTNSQLITLFGGVDTGIANAYVLNFAAPYSSLVNGIVIYWIASNTNTGPSTLNVNGTGPVNIINQSGAPLGAGQIIGGQMAGVAYYNGNWLLILAPAQIPITGSFSATVQGGSNAPLTCNYSVNGITVNINLPYCAFTSVNAFFSLAGLPAALQPAGNKVVPLAVVQDNSLLLSTGSAQIGNLNPGTITLLLNALANGWTASGVKGLGYHVGLTTFVGVTLGYNLL